MNCISSFGDSATAAIRDNPFSAAAWTQIQKKSSLLSIFMMGLMCVHIFVVLVQCKYHKRVCLLSAYISECWFFHRNVRLGDLLDFAASMLVLHALSKWGERKYEVTIVTTECTRPFFLPAEYTWVGQTDLSPALSVLKKTKMLNKDMYSTFMRTWAGSLSEGAVEH